MTVFKQLLNDYKQCLLRGDHSDGAAAYLALVDEYEQAARRAPAAPVPQIAEVQDSLVAISAAIADQDDSAAQSMLRDLLSMLAAAPQPPEAAPVELPAPEFYADDRGYEVSAEWLESEDATSDYRAVYTMPRYTEQQVRELLAAAKVERKPITADEIKEPKDGTSWRVVWWNESCRMMLPVDKALDSFQSYKNGTMQFTLKHRAHGIGKDKA
jgi:hypothetical protein